MELEEGGRGRWEGRRDKDNDRDIQTQTQRTLKGPGEPCVVVQSENHSSREIQAGELP